MKTRLSLPEGLSDGRPVELGDFPCKIYHFSLLDSTNQRLKEWMPPQDTLIYADFQTGGRGQGDHTWQCGQSMGLLMSLLYHPMAATTGDSLLQLTALMLCRTLESFGVAAQIKAPNDIMVGSKKLAGILLENTFQGSALATSIIGIGLNMYQEDFGNPADYAKPPVSLKQLGISATREDVICRFLAFFYQNISLNPSEIENYYQEKLIQ